ncbi:hypothetical protein C6576_13430 [Mammaliicoccus sciuri]|uniref:ABC transporter ATP-binding protein n=1 Tax=Mammaliicoccus sciuri TaxID=1296 RepID=UPI000D09BEFF|nr:ABC transporter ATP-binding protein [Mammaliicoccus sciuri]PSC77325.1 hypothetical protein C6576_13430 [Mammaliicoccus sciuri]
MFQAIKKLMWFFKDHWKRYSIAIILLLIANVVEVLPPWIVGQTIDKISDRSLTEQIYHQLVIMMLFVYKIFF